MPHSTAPTNVAFLTTKEAAEVLRLSPRTLEKLRQTGKGPTFRRRGARGRVMYEPSALERWLIVISPNPTTDIDKHSPLETSGTMPIVETDDTLMTASETAQYARISPSTLAGYRLNGGGPKFIKLGKRRSKVLYRKCHVDEWIDRQTVQANCQISISRAPVRTATLRT